MAVLTCLAETPGEVVRREHLEASVWPGMAIGYDALSNTVSKLRKQLDDDRRRSRYIETIPKVGYRLIAPVEPPRGSKPPDLRSAAVVAVAVAALAGGAWHWSLVRKVDIEPAHLEQTVPPHGRPSIAVLPFASVSSDRDQSSLSGDITADVVAELAKIDRLFVVSRHSMYGYKDMAVTPRQVASELGVSYVLNGSLRRTGEEVSINAELIEASTGEYLWAGRYDGGMNELPALRERLTKSIKNELLAALNGGSRPMLAARGTVDTDAFDSYLKGRSHYRRRTPHDFTAANDYLRHAVQIDPQFSEAYAALGALYWDALNREWYPALGLDPHAVRRGAAEYLDKPGASRTILGMTTSARMHMRLGEYHAAIDAAGRAVESDPYDPDARLTLAEVLVYAGRHRRAMTHARLPEHEDPVNRSYLSYIRGLAEFGLGRYESAAASLSSAVESNPDFRVPAAVLAAAYGLLQRRREAEAALELYMSEYRGCYDNINSTITMFFPYRYERDRTRLAEGLRLAGMSGF